MSYSYEIFSASSKHVYASQGGFSSYADARNAVGNYLRSDSRWANDTAVLGNFNAPLPGGGEWLFDVDLRQGIDNGPSFPVSYRVSKTI